MTWATWALAGILGVALLYVIVPALVEAFFVYRGKHTIRCPETGKDATVKVDTELAVFSSTLGRPTLMVEECSLWPEREDCDQKCLERDDAIGARPKGWQRKPARDAAHA